MMAEQRKRNRSSSVENSSDDSSSGLVVDYRNPPHGSSVSALMASIDSILAAETQQDAAHSSAWNTSGYQMSGLIGPSGIPSSSSSHPTSGSQGAGSQEWYIDAFETVRQSVQDLKTMLRLTDVEEEEKLPLQTRLEMLYRLDDDFQILIPPTSTLRITAQSNSRVSSQNASVPTHSASPVHSTQGSEGAGTQDIYATVEAIRDYVHDLETTLNDVLLNF
ncbi:hypothetical protein BCR39DRAFT_241064 [Naematelia encephala]|uniref:Uncharacterized protein n=1 Tax=Naematelia encephala TaxID=71784 RepID=A0A1Y2AWW6_9TREE|nr:hypothetical protein BCR39DRAFT_241064 [Naematelia encephala]